MSEVVKTVLMVLGGFVVLVAAFLGLLWCMSKNIGEEEMLQHNPGKRKE